MARALPLPRLARRRRWTMAALLGAAGFLLNLWALPLSPGTDLVLGGTLALLAAVALGPLPGLLAGAIAASRTVWLWGHPYAWGIFALEALAVGWLARRGMRPLLADLLFWLFGGVPLLFLTYGLLLEVRGPVAAVLFLKQPFNGLVAALVVEALLLLPRVRTALGVQGAPPLRAAISVVVALSATLPAAVFGIWTGRAEWTRNLERERERAVTHAGAYAAHLAQHVALHRQAVISAAVAGQQRGEFDPAQLQRLVAAEHGQFPGFTNVYAADARARAVAFHPLNDADGRPLVGLDFSDRAYVAELRRTRATVTTGVFAGRGGTQAPLVVIAHPIVLADTLAGYVLGALDLSRLPEPVVAAGAGGMRLRVADAGGTLVLDTGRPYGPGDPPRPAADAVTLAAVRGAGADGAVTFSAEREESRAAAARVAAEMLAGVAPIAALGWTVWAEEPMASIQDAVSASYVRLLALLIAATLVALAVSSILAGRLAWPLLRIRAVAGRLAEGELDARVGPMSAAVATEIAGLGRGFDEMADALSRRAEELERLGEIARSLASTLDPDEVLRQVTEAAVRLVHPDGCGIALLQPGGRTVRGAPSAWGLLAAAAGRELAVGDSLMGRVAASGQSLLVREVGAAARIHRPLADLEGAGSAILAPLVGRSGTLGTLAAVRGRDNPHPFDSADLRLLERLARHAAVAVENAHLVAAERRRAEESDAVRTVARVLSAAQGLRETLAVVVREAARIVGAEGCRVELLRDGGTELEVVAAAGEAGPAAGSVFRVAGELAEGPVRRGEHLLRNGAESVVAVPLRVGDETLGVLTAHRRGGAWDDDDVGLLAAFADHAAIALRNARLLEAAQTASRAKSDFIATMSHELRTPLNAVLGHLELLEMELHGPVTAAQRESLGRIGTASRHLRGLIEEVLSFSRLEAGHVDLSLATTDLAELAVEVGAVVEPLATGKGLVFRTAAPPGGVPVRTDPDKVRQILINLAGNAAKFTDQGEVEVRVERRGHEAAVAVRDTGPGIAPADQARLFRPFEQLDSGFSRPHGGTGLGLYLSSRYAELVGGRIELHSEPGRGSTFTLVVPCAGPGERAEGGTSDDAGATAEPAGSVGDAASV